MRRGSGRWPAVPVPVISPVYGGADVTARQPDWQPRPEWGVAVGWAWQRSPADPEPAVDVSGRTDVTARQPDW